MTMLNGLFFLMIGLAGLATALILADLNRREDEALAELARLQSGKPAMAASRSSHRRSCDHAYVTEGLSSSGHMNYATMERSGRLDDFLTVADMKQESDHRCRDRAVSFDFAIFGKQTDANMAGAEGHSFASDAEHCA